MSHVSTSSTVFSSPRTFTLAVGSSQIPTQRVSVGCVMMQSGRGVKLTIVLGA